MLFSAASTQGLCLKYDKRIWTSHRYVTFPPFNYPTNSKEPKKLTEDREYDISMSIICIAHVMSCPSRQNVHDLFYDWKKVKEIRK